MSGAIATNKKAYRDYFPKATTYTVTNFGGERGLQRQEGEIFLDLEKALPDSLRGKFDVVFNHTTLEHVFDCQLAFKNLSEMSRDILITVVPFCQNQHELPSFKDYAGVRQPVCATCIAQVNIQRMDNGLDAFIIPADAYEACDENELG